MFRCLLLTQSGHLPGVTDYAFCGLTRARGTSPARCSGRIGQANPIRPFLGAVSCSSVSWHSFLPPHLRELHSILISPSIPRASAWTTKVSSSNGSLATTLATPCRQAWLRLQEYLVSLKHGPAKIG